MWWCFQGLAESKQSLSPPPSSRLTVASSAWRVPFLGVAGSAQSPLLLQKEKNVAIFSWPTAPVLLCCHSRMSECSPNRMAAGWPSPQAPTTFSDKHHHNYQSLACRVCHCRIWLSAAIISLLASWEMSWDLRQSKAEMKCYKILVHIWMLEWLSGRFHTWLQSSTGVRKAWRPHHTHPHQLWISSSKNPTAWLSVTNDAVNGVMVTAPVSPHQHHINCRSQEKIRRNCSCWTSSSTSKTGPCFSLFSPPLRPHTNAKLYLLL